MIADLESRLQECYKSLALLENILQNSTDAIAVLDQDFYFTKLNHTFLQYASRIFSTKVSIGMNFFIILADFPELKNEIQSVYDGESLQKKVITVENNIDNEEAYYCCEISINKFPGNTSEITNFICIIKNISEFKLHQRRILKQQSILANTARMDAIGEMASAFAHEINQPLAAINIYSHACLNQLKSELIVNEKLRNGLSQIHHMSQHAGEILHKMKNFIRDGKIFVEKSDINQVVKQTLTFMEHQKIELKFKVNLILDESLPKIFLDKVKVTQVILNLIQNSIEAFQKEKKSRLEISITTSLDDRYIEVNLKDNGPGIPDNLKNNIMQPYFTTKSHGTGLGLAICRTIIEAHGGKLSIQQSNKNGASITFTLPVINETFYG